MKSKIACILLCSSCFFSVIGCSIHIPQNLDTNLTPSLAITSSSEIIITKPDPNQTTITPTLIKSLEPSVRETKIHDDLENWGDCPSTCFLGIIPGKTSTNEARRIMSFFGLDWEGFYSRGNYYIDFKHQDKDGLRISSSLESKEQLINNIEILLDPSQSKRKIPTEWGIFSPVAIIERFGTPSQVKFDIAFAPETPVPGVGMTLVFDEINLNVDYFGESILKSGKGSQELCPLIVRWDEVRVYMGDRYDQIKHNSAAINDVAEMSTSEFASLIQKPPEEACFKIDLDYFMQRK
jgi:hypothetical protein